jgi:hypothetical protein
MFISPLFRKVCSLKFIIYSFALIIVCANVTSCGKKTPTLDGVDLAVWKGDKNACKGDRKKFAEAITKEKTKLLALDEIKIVNLLGNPDRNELLKRNQKVYYYFLDPALECAGDSLVTSQKLIIRFNAMGLAKEVEVK